jgi:hypothetical protein
MKAEIAETNGQLERLRERLEDTEAQKEEAAAAIAEANHLIHLQKNSTSAEVFRLKGTLPRPHSPPSK